MSNTRSAVFTAVMGLFLGVCGNAAAQRRHTPSKASQAVLALAFSNNGQHVSTWVGQQIEISLGTIGPGQYTAPEISSPAVQFVSTAQEWPPNPGGPSFIYIFETVAEGEARIKIPVSNCGNVWCTNDLTFAVTIQVGPAGRRPQARVVLRSLDQANTAPWQNAWTNLLNDVRQSFRPSRPRLTAVEVELVAANPGPASAQVSLMVLNEEGIGLAVVTKSVPLADCGHVLFILPGGGLRVLPGHVYSIGLRGDSAALGWKYVLGGYARGTASFNGRPLLPEARSTFLFRTFGSS